MKRNIFVFFVFFPILSTQANDVFRIYSENKSSIRFQNKSGKILNLPSGTRIINSAEENNYFVYDRDSQTYQAYKLVEKNNIQKRIWPPTNLNRAEDLEYCFKHSQVAEVFKNEAMESIDLARKGKVDEYKELYRQLKKSYPKMASEYVNPAKKFKIDFPEYDKLLSSIEKKLANKKFLKVAEKQENEILKSLDLAPVEKLKYHQNLIEKSFDPTDDQVEKKSFSQTTLYVPLNLSWLKQNPQISNWIDKNWIEAEIPYPFSGSSGEGIGASQDDFLKVKNVLLKLRDYIFGLEMVDLISVKSNPHCGLVEPNLSRKFFQSDEAKW